MGRDIIGLAFAMPSPAVMEIITVELPYPDLDLVGRGAGDDPDCVGSGPGVVDPVMDDFHEDIQNIRPVSDTKERVVEMARLERRIRAMTDRSREIVPVKEFLQGDEGARSVRMIDVSSLIDATYQPFTRGHVACSSIAGRTGLPGVSRDFALSTRGASRRAKNRSQRELHRWHH